MSSVIPKQSICEERAPTKTAFVCLDVCVSLFMYICVLIQEFVYSPGQTNMNECVYVSLSLPL